MRGYDHTENARRLRRGALHAIGDRLRAEYEGIVLSDVPPAFRALIAKLDEQGSSRDCSAKKESFSGLKSRTSGLLLMRTLVLTAIVFTVTASTVNAQHSPKMVPEGWSEVPTPRTPGRRFVSGDGDSWMVARAARAGRSVRNAMDAIAYRDGERITYQRRGRSWIAVSGFKGGRIFYRKSNLACHGTEWHHIELEYPAAAKRRMDATVTRIARGMTTFNKDCALTRRAAR